MTVDTQIKADTTPTQDKVELPVTTAKVEATNEPAQANTASIEQQEDPNFKAFREARKKDRLAREDAERRAREKEAEANALKAAMEAAFSKSAPSPQAYQQYYGIQQESEETEDQRIEKKVNQLLAAKEDRYRKEAYEREQTEYPTRLLQAHPDFNHVTAQENLDYLDYHYPEVSRPLQRLQEGFDKWSDIYHAVKKFVPNHSTAKREAQKAEINQMKPKSISSASMTPPGELMREDPREVEKRRAANFERMQRIIKGI